MKSSQPEMVTRILQDLQEGRRDAVDDLFRLVYDELHALARQQRQRWQGDYTLNTTALVHEAYLKLVGQQEVSVENRAHFFALASKAMRHILSNYALRQRREKRGGKQPKLSLHELQAAALEQRVALSPERADALLALDEALQRLEELSLRQSQVVECRFYGGMSVPETAQALGVSPATVKRDWSLARAWLYREMQD